ncbi:hypothetical protein CLORY_12450 [Clostridium oryzae]|uniref:Uncharacterized protein n=1 Tax=Clostridium oryzae TaxID=1450648 RepID=A0A1V4ITT9_9CLOT|nr:hypothetical protein CLORY_12450 [Clostridium oryzae]
MILVLVEAVKSIKTVAEEWLKSILAKRVSHRKPLTIL